jgi:hypothetical protein
MTPRQLAKKLHQLWGRVQDVHLEAAALLDHLDAGDPSRRLALELALHDLLALSARAATLAAFVEAAIPHRKGRK